MIEQSISMDGTREEVLENAKKLIDSVKPEQSMVALVITHSEESFRTDGTQLVIGVGSEDVIQALCGYQESILEKIAQHSPQAEQIIRMNLITRLAADANLGGN